jgi:hypothetical protein
MHKRFVLSGMALLAVMLAVNLASGSAGANGPKVSPVQSPARPLGMSTVGPVYLSGSDARSKSFNSIQLPEFQQIINVNLQERVKFTAVSGFKLDASRLFLKNASDATIRVYFIAEGAAYHNTLAYSFSLAGDKSGPANPKLIFPDVSAGTKRTSTEPLQPGDFVDLGMGAAGTQIDFFLVSDGVNGGKTKLFNNPKLNSDGLQHVVAFLLPSTRFILIGFEDIVGGGDLDYNDALFAVDIGEENAAYLGQINDPPSGSIPLPN